MKITLILIAVTFACFIAQAIYEPFFDYFALTPTLAFSGQLWQFLTYMFLHGGVFHIGFNMIALLIFGVTVERALGTNRFLTLYFLSGLGSAFLYIFLAGITDTPLIGASGAAFGVLTAYAFIYPRNWILIFPGIPLPSVLAVIAFIGISIFFGTTGLDPGIAHWGHLGGIATGILLMFFWKKERDMRQRENPERMQTDWEDTIV